MAAQPIGNLEKVRALAVSGRTLAVGGVRAAARSQIVFYDVISDTRSGGLDVPAHVLGLAADAAGFVAACSDGMLRWYEAPQAKEAPSASEARVLVREVMAHAGGATSVAIFGDKIWSAGVDGALRSFSRKTGAPGKSIALSARPLRAVAIDPTGTAVAGAGDDGTVSVVWLDDERRRDMRGHDGPALCLTFTPADGRLVSGGDDGTVRIWFLAGEVEADVRGRDDAGHAGGTTAIVFVPSENADEVGERFFTAGNDGKVRLWRVSERRKPRTFEPRGTAAIGALAFAAVRRPASTGRLYAGGDSRTVCSFPFDAKNQPQNTRDDFGNGFDVLAAALNAPARAAREQAVKFVTALDEPEGLELALQALASDKEPEVRALVATEIATKGRRDARRALRLRLDDEHALVRSSAFAALTVLERDLTVNAPRAALASRFADTRAAGLEALPPLAGTSPLVQSLLATHLADADASVRRVAVRALLATHPGNATTALRTAFERGAPDVRAEVLVRGALEKLLVAPDFAPLVGKALDDEDAHVRRIAFVVNTFTRPALAAWLETKDESFGRAVKDVVERACTALGLATPTVGLDPELSTVRGISGPYAQFMHPTHGEVAIFKPNLHTPIAPDDRVHLVGLKQEGAQMRATDYVKGGAASAVTPAQIQGVRAALLPPVPPSAAPSEVEREPLLAALACRTPDTSFRGARGLALLGDMRALGALLTISREPDPALRRDAALTLSALADKRAKRRLSWMMSDTDADVRRAALESFGNLEPDPIAVAAMAVQSAYEDVRARGLDLLVKQGKDEPRAEQILANTFEDESAKVRAEALRTLWAWHTQNPMGPLDRALIARFPDLRLRAVQELAQIAKAGEPKAVAEAAAERVTKTIADRDPHVARAAYVSTLERRGKGDVDTHLAAMASTRAELRTQGARDAVHAPFDKVRSVLTKLLEDTDSNVRVAAIETLDALSKDDLGALYVGLQSSHIDLRVRAAELLSMRRDERIENPMQALIADIDLLKRNPVVMVPLRQRAATALANLGTPKLLRYFATELILDEDGVVREQAARGVSNASRHGEEGFLLDLMGHAEIAVRSWAGEGLARLGDARALPVLTGTLRHEHPPIRIGAIISFAALGPEGYGGMLQGLDDASRDVQRIVLSVILARDLRSFRAGESPELLASALSSARPEVRFAAARALELRMTPELYLAHLVEALLPELPEKAEEVEKWPDEGTRARLMTALADAIAGDRPEQRYAAAQALRLRDRPLAFFYEVQRAVKLRSTTAPFVPETAPRVIGAESAPAKKSPLGLLRRLFASGPETAEDTAEAALPAPSPLSELEQKRLRLLAFGAYVGLLRQAAAEDESHRVRRDAVARITELTTGGHVSVTSSALALARALDDPNHLVRRAAFQALRTIYATDAETPLALALMSSAPDVARAALDELAARGEAGRARIVKALDSDVAEARKYAFELLEKSAAPGSLEPLLAALGSVHADVRIGVLVRLSTSQDPRVATALGKALESDHEDLRLRAAELLADRKDERGVDVLASAIRSDDAAISMRGIEALARIGTRNAVLALGARIEELAGAENVDARTTLLAALGRKRVVDAREGAAEIAAIDALIASLNDESTAIRNASLASAESLVGPRADTEVRPGAPKPRAPNQVLALRFYEAAAKSRYHDARLAAALRFDDLPSGPPWTQADSALVALFSDRNIDVRAKAARSYARRVEKKGADSAPLEALVRGGARETMLAAAEGLAFKRAPLALRPLLLFVRAGEEGERERALLGLGALGDKRALAELELVANGGTEDAPAEESMQAAALEALGRICGSLENADQERVRDRVEAAVGGRIDALSIAAVRALRYLGDGRARALLETRLLRALAPAERAAAAKALGEIPNASSEAALVEALHDADFTARTAARTALDATFPSERTRVELAAVESPYADISAPAAAYLASDGETGELLAKLEKIADPALRLRLRFGLARRATVPAEPLTRLLGSGSARARADAAWIAGAHASTLSDADRKALGAALTHAASAADVARREAAKRGKETPRREETDVCVRAVWACRRVAPAAIAPVARKLAVDEAAPFELRIEALRALGISAEDNRPLRQVLLDASVTLRSEAASALGRISVAEPLHTLATTPLDAIVLERVAGPQPITENALARPETHSAYTALALQRGDLAALIAEARNAKAAGRLDAIAALGLAPHPQAIAVLAEISAKASKEPADVKKAAYRSLRRAQRILARRENASSTTGGAVH